MKQIALLFFSCIIATVAMAQNKVTIDFSKPIATGSPMVFGGTQPRGLSDEQWDVLERHGFKFMRSQADLTLLVPCESPEAYKNNENDCSNPQNWDWKNGIYGDDFVKRAADRNMAVCLVIKNARWNRFDGAPDDEETFPRDLEVWQDIVTKIVNHYKGEINYIECYNEVDREPQFLMQGSGQSKKEGYKKVVLAGINAVRQSDYPQTKIGGTAAAGFGFDELTWLLEDREIMESLGLASFHYFDSPDYPHQKVVQLKQLLQKYNLDADIVRSSYTPEFKGDNPFNKPGTTQPEHVAVHLIGALKDGLAAAGLWEIQNREGKNDFRYWFDNGETVATARLFSLLSNKYKLGEGSSQIFDVSGAGFSEAFAAINMDKEYAGAFVNRENEPNNFQLSVKNTEFNGAFRLRYTLLANGKDSVFCSKLVKENDELQVKVSGNSVLGFKIIHEANRVMNVQPVNPKASEEAKAVLQFLYEIKGDKIISGMHNELNSNKWTEFIIEKTGERPGLWGSDFRYGEHVQYRQQMVDEAIRQWKEENVLVTLMYHATRPVDPIDGIWKDENSPEGVQGELTDEQWEQLVTPGTAVYKQWLRHIDAVAEYLKQMRDANVPVLWRPYHEMNGGWFWWGKKSGKNGYVKLWQMMFDRYVNHHDLNNLIWVWNPNAPNKHADDYHLYYPGDQYVDVLATDIYNKDYEQSYHDDLLDLAGGKPIAIGETGPMIPVDSLMQVQPHYVWFMGWRDLFAGQDEQHLRSLFRHHDVLNAPLKIHNKE